MRVDEKSDGDRHGSGVESCLGGTTDSPAETLGLSPSAALTGESIEANGQ